MRLVLLTSLGPIREKASYIGQCHCFYIVKIMTLQNYCCNSEEAQNRFGRCFGLILSALIRARLKYQLTVRQEDLKRKWGLVLSPQPPAFN